MEVNIHDLLILNQFYFNVTKKIALNKSRTSNILDNILA